MRSVCERVPGKGGGGTSVSVFVGFGGVCCWCAGRAVWASERKRSSFGKLDGSLRRDKKEEEAVAHEKAGAEKGCFSLTHQGKTEKK